MPARSRPADVGIVFSDHRAVIAEFTQHHMAVLWRDGFRVDWLKPLLPMYRHVLERSQP